MNRHRAVLKGLSKLSCFSFRLITILLFFCSPFALGAEKVVLQLKWEHEFQFAGYYAALWQGYYEDEGLEVEILPASRPEGGLVSPSEELIEGRADFAIGALDILVHKDRGEDLVVLAPIFQRSPNSVFTLPGKPFSTIDDLSKLSIATPSEDFTQAEMMALFNAYGIDYPPSKFIDKPPSIDSLLDGSADAIATYSVSALSDAREKGVALQELSPRDFGLDFYGDTLYTHQRLIDSNPALVERFLRASIKGWDYALNHKSEIAKRIARNLPRHLFTYQDFEAYNLAFADVIDGYMAYPYTEIGHNNQLRWQRMVSKLKSIGVIKNDLDIEQLIYRPGSKKPDNGGWTLAIVVTGLLLIFILYYTRQFKYLWLLYGLSLVVIYFTERNLEEQWQKDYQKDLEVDVLQQLNAIAANLSGTVNRNLAYLSSTAAHVSTNPDIDQREFARYAHTIFRQKPLLLNLAGAPDLVVSLVYPLEENLAALGLNYRANAAQRDLVLRVKESGELAVAGPLILVQGGVAFIARTAVVTVNEWGDEYFWGVLSAPFLAESLYRQAGLYNPDISVNIAIRGRDGRGASGDAFYGDSSLFSFQRSLKASIRVGDGTWQIAAAPKGGWQYQGQGLMLMRGMAASFALMLLIFLLWQRHQVVARESYERQIRDNERLLREMSRVALINGWRIPAPGNTIHWSMNTSNILGLPAPEGNCAVESLLANFDIHQAEKLKFAIANALETGKDFDLELMCTASEGDACWIRWIGHAECARESVNGNAYDITGAVQDITERKKFTEVVEKQASYDLLTGLPNRSSFYGSLKWAIAEAKRNKTKLAVLFIDLDKFKPVNDNFGHEAGDLLLQEVAKRIRACLRESDTVARISGDEFTVILRQISHNYAPVDIAEKVLGTIKKPYEIQARQIYCGASIGIAVCPDDSQLVDDLISKADYAMYEVKKSGRNGCQYFTHEMQARSERRNRMYSQLQDAIVNEQLTVVYQPIIDLETGLITKCEALVRWYDGEGNEIPTAEFITLAEETSLVNEIDYFVLKQAGRYIRTLQQREGINVALSVNVSPRVFSSTDAALNTWLELASEMASQIDLTIEITERLLIQGPDRAMQVLHKLKASGATIAIDDFGIGYSSLSYLAKLPIDYIKIDRSFVQNVDANRSTRLLVDTIISLAKNLDLKLVGEGVETDRHRQMLKEKGCDYAQGYLLGRPMTGEKFQALFESSTEGQAVHKC